MWVLPLALLTVVFANSDRSRTGTSFRSLRSWHHIAPEVQETREDLRTALARAPPIHREKVHEEFLYPILLIVAAGVSVSSFVLLALARYFCSYDSSHRYYCFGCDKIRFAYFLAVVAAANWSAMNVTFHVATKFGMSALEALFWRSAANFGIGTLVVLFTRGTFLPRKNRFWLFVRSICSCGSVIGLYIAIVQMAFVDAVALYALMPFFALLFTYLLRGEVPGNLLLGLVATSFIGAMMVIQPLDLFEYADNNQAKFWSALAAITSAAFAAFGSVIVNMFPRDLPANMQVLWFGVLGLLIAPLIMLLQGSMPHEILVKSVTHSENGLFMTVAVLIIGGSSYLMQLAYGWSLELHRAGHITTVFQCSELSMQWAVGVLVLNQALNAWRVCGVLIVLTCGGLLVSLGRAKDPSPDQEPPTPDTKSPASSARSSISMRQEASRPPRKPDDTD